MSGVATLIGGGNLGLMVPLLGTAQASISATAAVGRPRVAGQLAGAARLGLALTVAAPTANVQAEADAAVEVATRIAARIAAGITAPSIGLRATANAALVAALAAELGALDLQLAFALGLGALALNGGIAAYAYNGTPDSAGAAVHATLGGGLPGGGPTDNMKALILATSSIATWDAMGQVLKTG